MINWLINFFLYKKCSTCNDGRVPRYALTDKNILMLQCADGVDSIEVCDDCYDVFDKVEQAYVERNTI